MKVSGVPCRNKLTSNPSRQVLGRPLRFVLYKGVKALALETEDFARQCVDLYEALSDKAVKQFQTPHVDPGSLVVSDEVPRGELSASAARMVMKLLWLARLSRPDILVAVTLLAAKVTTWSTNEDRMVARLVGYVSHSAHCSSIWFIGDASHSLSLSLYVDSDFGGCLYTARSTSGNVLALEGPASFALLSWSSRRQKVVSRSSTEAEFVSLSSSLFSDALPMLEVWQQLIPGISLQCWEDNEACIAIVKKGFSAKLRHLSKTQRINVASVCETVNGHQDIKLSYINTSKQRGDPDTKALCVQKWSHALDLLSISTQRLPDFPDSK